MAAGMAPGLKVIADRDAVEPAVLGLHREFEEVFVAELLG
jgi:hypothetical protein